MTPEQRDLLERKENTTVIQKMVESTTILDELGIDRFQSRRDI